MGVLTISIIIFLVVLAVSFATFTVGRIQGLEEVGDAQRSLDALRNLTEEELKNEQLRKEEETLLSRGMQAQDNIRRWEEIKQAHKNIENLRQELNDFEREESDRIDELERQRIQKSQMLAALHSTLATYPSEIFSSETDWSEKLQDRKEAYDKITTHIESAIDNLDSTCQQQEDIAKEIEALEKKAQTLEESIQLLDQAKSDLESQYGIPQVTDKQTPVDKLSAFKIMPECLRGYDNQRDVSDESDLLEGFKSTLDKTGLRYPDRIIRAFHTALKVNDLSPLTVLSGLSGTGKSQLPKAYARYFGIHFLHVPVEPGWDSPQDLLGFYDFVAERYRPTDRARALGHFDTQFVSEIGIESRYDWSNRMLLILLDEMNLARTEYYFSEFLSRLEMRGPRTDTPADESSRVDAQIAIDLPYGEQEKPKHLYIPHNVLWVGTLNEDESTQALSDKVLDRANSIRFAPPDPKILGNSTAPSSSIDAAPGHLSYKQWRNWSEQKNLTSDANKLNETIATLAQQMKDAKRGFGYRIAQSIKVYIERYPGSDWRVPMVDQINMRLLPKLAGSELSDCETTLEQLKKLCEDDLGDQKFSGALSDAIDDSQASQIFTWPGFTYEEASI